MIFICLYHLKTKNYAQNNQRSAKNIHEKLRFQHLRSIL